MGNSDSEEQPYISVVAVRMLMYLETASSHTLAGCGLLVTVRGQNLRCVMHNDASRRTPENQRASLVAGHLPGFSDQSTLSHFTMTTGFEDSALVTKDNTSNLEAD